VVLSVLVVRTGLLIVAAIDHGQVARVASRW
jgi:hypothetical protein